MSGPSSTPAPSRQGRLRVLKLSPAASRTRRAGSYAARAVTRYVAVAERQVRESRATSLPMRPAIVRWHAFAVDAGGWRHGSAVCGWTTTDLPVRSWDEVNFRTRCRACRSIAG